MFGFLTREGNLFSFGFLTREGNFCLLVFRFSRFVVGARVSRFVGVRVDFFFGLMGG